MKNNNSVIIGWVAAVVVIAGLVWYGVTGYVAVVPETITNTVTTPTTPVTPGVQAKQAGLPKVVTSFTVSPTDTTVVLSGTVVPNGVFTNYWYEYGTTPNLGYKTTGQSVGSGYTAIPAPIYITGLAKNTAYYFYLVAENQFGKVSGVQYSFRTTDLGNLPLTGTVPTTKTLAAENLSRTGANLMGLVSQTTTQYWFEYGKTNNLGNITALFAHSIGGDISASAVVAVPLTGLDPLTTYYFRINAQNKFGTVNGAVLNFKTNGPLAATAPKATTSNANNVAKSTATLNGKINPNGADSSYWFEYGTDSLLGSLLIMTTDRVAVGSGVNEVSAKTNISNLNSNTTYYFRIVTRNDLGTVRGNNLSFKTKTN